MHKIDVLNRHCETVGRDSAEIRKNCGLCSVIRSMTTTI